MSTSSRRFSKARVASNFGVDEGCDCGGGGACALQASVAAITIANALIFTCKPDLHVGRDRISNRMAPARPTRRSGLLASIPWDVIARRGSQIDLPRAHDLLIRIVEHLFPLRDPARGARN